MNRSETILQQLAEQHNLRQLRHSTCSANLIEVDGREYTNLSTNDYLGIGGNTKLQAEFFATLNTDSFIMSNPSSRLMTGNSPHYNALEHAIEQLFRDKQALVLSNGYAVNSGVLPAITTKNDLIIADKFSHASLIDGLRLCEAKWLRYAHNDMEHLESLITKHRADYDRVWVVTESIFSMDGDKAPLKELVALKEQYDLNLYLDEAHSFGVCAVNGAGYASELGVADKVDIIIATLGKALASVGAFVVCDRTTRELLVNRMRTLIFSTALPPLNLMWSRFLIEQLGSFAKHRERLQELISMFAMMDKNGSTSQIIPIMTYDNLTTQRVADHMKGCGFWVTPIRTPTVPEGKARIRISLSATMEKERLEQFIELCNNIG